MQNLRALEVAKENIREYRWALSRWLRRDERYSPGYLILYIAGARARAGRALELLAGGEAPDLKEEITKLENRLHEDLAACNEEWILNDEDGVEYFLSVAEKLIHEFAGIAEDSVLTGLDEDSLRDVGIDFLLLFQDIAHFIEWAKKFLGPEALAALHRRYRTIEATFRQSFRYFTPLKDILVSMREREGSAGFWWLRCDPEEEKPEEGEDVLMEKLLAAVAGQIREEKVCDIAEEDVIAYALGDLTGEEKDRIREHVLECDYCLDLVIDARLAMAEHKRQGGR